MIVTETLNIDSWKLSTSGEKLYSADAVIDAYLKGKKDQLEQSQKALIRQMENNLAKAARDMLKVVEYLTNKGLTPLSAHLKPNTFYHMEVLITVSERDFLSDAITDAYDYICSIEEGGSDDLYHVTFNLIDEGKNFDESLLESDGYAFKRDLRHLREVTEKVKTE